jgi:hypothetical protein
MRINELLEGTLFKDADFVSPQEDGKRDINFDLVDDLTHYMETDDDVYRRHVHPVVSKFIEMYKGDKDCSASMFKPAAEKSYQMYIRKFPIRELPDQLDEKICKQVCDKISEDLKQHIANDKYED